MGQEVGGLRLEQGPAEVPFSVDLLQTAHQQPFPQTHGRACRWLRRRPRGRSDLHHPATGQEGGHALAQQAGLGLLQQALHREAQQQPLGVSVALREQEQQRRGLPTIEQLAGFGLESLGRWWAGNTPDQQSR